MRYIISGIRSSLISRLKSPKLWIALGIVLLVVAAVNAFPAEEASAPVQVGIVLPEEGGEAFWSLLEERSGTVLTFHKTDADTVDRNIAAGKWDCGIILAEDFARCVETVNMNRAFTIRIGEGSAVYPLVREVIAACAAQLISPYIAEEYMLQTGIVESEEVLEQLRPQLTQVLDESKRVNVILSTPDGEPLEPIELADRGVDLILCWVVSAVLLVWLLLCATDLARWIGTPAARRMVPLRSVTSLMVTKIGGDGVLTLLIASGAMVLLKTGVSGCMAVLCYGLFWLSAAVLLAHFGSVSNILPVCVPFVMVISLLMSSVLVDISMVVPRLSIVGSWLPARLFLDICQGKFEAMAALLGGAAICLLASMAVDALRKPRAGVRR